MQLKLPLTTKSTSYGVQRRHRVLQPCLPDRPDPVTTRATRPAHEEMWLVRGRPDQRRAYGRRR